MYLKPNSAEVDNDPKSAEANASSVEMLSSKPCTASIPASTSHHNQQQHLDASEPHGKRQKIDDDNLSIISSGQLESVLGHPHEYHSTRTAPENARSPTAPPPQKSSALNLQTGPSHEAGELGLGTVADDDGVSSLEGDSSEAKQDRGNAGSGLDSFHKIFEY
eukprot:scaffold1748_cov164-Amphora_coffeaeformis.AAC.8